ncbi:MAG: glycosyltransferase [Anaerolineae bacterium]|nr:glycosyltransferase [Anaerolineae bacterium]
MPEISIIVPVYNAERYLGSCMEALLSQSYPKERYEIIVVDNGSTDVSAGIVRSYPDITLLFEGRRGAYVARNRGIAEAHSAILAFTDPDCIPQPDWLENIAAATRSPETKIVVGRQLPVGGSAILSMIAAYEDAKNKYIFGSDIQELYYGYTNNMTVRRELFEELGPFLERRRGSDTIFVHNVLAHCSSSAVRYDPDVRVQHMEFDSLVAYWQKRLVYGSSRRQYREISCNRSLNWHERALVFQRTIRYHRYSPAESLCLLCLLAITAACWKLGYWTATRSADQIENGVA